MDQERYVDALQWAAQLHEIGLSIAHSQYHKHGAYLLEYSDMSGFTRTEQRLLAALVRGHRRKFPRSAFTQLPEDGRLAAQRLCLILRLAVTLYRGRSERPLPRFSVVPKQRGMDLVFPEGWLDEHPLTQADLMEEAAFLKAAGLKLKLR